MGVPEAIQKAIASTTEWLVRSGFLSSPFGRFRPFQLRPQLLHRHFFRFGLDFDGDFLSPPAVREVVHVDEVVMCFRLWAVPAFNRARNVEHRLPVPSRQRLLRGLFNAQAIGVATVMMNVVDQRDAGGLAHRENLAIHSEAADAVVGTKLKCGQ